MNHLFHHPLIVRIFAANAKIGAVGLAGLLLIGHNASAQVNQATADAAFNAYNSAFLTQSGGQAFYRKGSGTSSTDLKPQGTWGEALDIEAAEDAYRSHRQRRK